MGAAKDQMIKELEDRDGLCDTCDCRLTEEEAHKERCFNCALDAIRD